jgi:hypothetical protein
MRAARVYELGGERGTLAIGLLLHAEPGAQSGLLRRCGGLVRLGGRGLVHVGEVEGDVAAVLCEGDGGSAG